MCILTFVPLFEMEYHVANLFEMEYMFIHSPIGKEQGRKNVQFSKVVNISFFLYSVSFMWKEEPWFRVCLVKLE